MIEHLAVLASLGLAILLSPEIFILGLVAASDKKIPRTTSWVFALGTAIGLAIWVGIGFLVTPEQPAVKAAPTWFAFSVRATIGSALIVVGLYRAYLAFKKQPISDGGSSVDSHGTAHKPSLAARFKAWIFTKIPWLERLSQRGQDPSNAGRIRRSLILGFVLTGVHPKVFPIGIAAGHQALQLAGGVDRTVGLLVFSAIALLPSVLPALIETAKPGAALGIKEACEHFMKVNGRWIASVLLLSVGAYMWWNAAHEVPGEQPAAPHTPPAMVSPAK